MKTANTILAHIRNLPEFKPLKSHYCYQKFISLLSPLHQKAIAFVYVRHDTLFIALSHPGFKMELNYNRDLLKDILTLLRNKDEKCKSIKASKVVLFNSKHNSILKKEKPYDSVPHYKEMAWGNFTIQSEDEKMLEAFETIKASIAKQQ